MNSTQIDSILNEQLLRRSPGDSYLKPYRENFHLSHMEVLWEL